MSKTVVIGVVFVLGVLAFLVYSSMHIAKYRVEVCVAFQGRRECRTASADSKDHALRSAQSNACALLVSGVTETMQCERVEPTTIKWLETK
jgi:hypothetical protein